MAKLNKSQNGLIFYDDFKEPTLLWTLSPSDANSVRFGDNGLTMLHHRRYTTFTITEPEAEEYSCIVELDHVPYNYDDIGGVIVISNNKEYAECQSFLATGPSELGNASSVHADVQRMVDAILDDSYVRYTVDNTALPELTTNEPSTQSEKAVDNSFIDTQYRFIKFSKQKYKYVFWASKTGSDWIEIGNVSFEDSGVIGFFLFGTTDQDIIDHSHFNVKSIAIYTSRYLTIDSISRDYEFEIINGDGNILLRTDSIAYAHLINRANNRCLLNTATLPMPIKNGHLRIYHKDDYDNTFGYFDLGSTVYGGDVFTLEHNIKAFIHNTEVTPFEVFDLGTFARGYSYILMVVQNCEEYAVTNIHVSVSAYSEYYVGHDKIELALSLEDVPDEDLVYDKVITIDKIESGATKAIYIKLTDQMMDMFYHAANRYMFKITIE